MAALSASPYMRAAVLISSAGIPDISSTYSGVYFSMVSLKASNPSVRVSMYSFARRPSFRMTFIRPLRTATFVPGFGRSQIFAYFTSGILRGSTTISFAPCCRTARLIREPITGWFSVVFVPIARIASVNSISSMELVIAPDPSVAARPATVTECQRRAQ